MKYKQNPQCSSFGVDMWAEKEYLVNLPQDRFQSNHSFIKLDRFAQINFALCCQVEHAKHLLKTYA